MADNKPQAVIDAPEDNPATPGILETWMRSAATKVKDKMQPATATQIYQAATSAPTLAPEENKGDGVFTDGKAAE